MKQPSGNFPPEHGIRVPAHALRQLVATLGERADLRVEDAGLLADLLVRCDLRCVFSHGTRLAAHYLPMILEGKLNPRPCVEVVEESATTLVLDGDGGLGYFPCWRGAGQLLDKVAEHGMAALTTRNHYHFGAAGLYSRMGLPRDLIGIAISSHRYWPEPDQPVSAAGINSPLSIAVPAGEQPPLVLDMANPVYPGLFGEYPALVFKTLGLGAAIQALGAILPGIYRPEFQEPQSPWQTNQGAFVAFFDVRRFLPVDEFRKEMDRFIGQVRAMQPLPGTARAELAGGIEWAWEREHLRHGIPVGAEHRQDLEDIAAELGVEVPFGDYDQNRF